MSENGNHIFVFWIIFITGTANMYNFMDSIRGEHLMQAYRSHLYQYLSNELKLPHWKVTLLYAVVQLSQDDETKTY